MPKQRIITIAALPMILLALALPSSADVSVRFLDVGEGDAIWVHDDVGYDVLIDGGDGAIDVHRKTVVQHWNAILWTHGHADHMGGLIPILQVVPVDLAYWNGQETDTATFRELMLFVGKQHVPMQMLVAGDVLAWGSCEALVVHPDRVYHDENNDSVVIRLDTGSATYLLTGDAEWEAEEAMLESGLPLDADVLKVGHHGSVSSTSSQFLAAVQPTVAVISVGGNSYGHPSPVVLGRLRERGIDVWRTELDGDVTAHSDGMSLIIEPEIAPESRWVYLPVVLVGAKVTPTPTQTATPVPTQTQMPTATPFPLVTPTCEPCPCSGNTLNCSDFATQAEAQTCFDHCWEQTGHDIHRLDSDGDGEACESLP